MSATVQPISHSQRIKPRVSGLKALVTHQTFRRLVQIGFAVFIIVVIAQHVAAEATGAITASPEAYCPLGGLETLYQYVTAGGTFISHTHLSNLVVLAATLLAALLFRNAFCGWICPLGFLQDLVSNLRSVLMKRIPALRRFMNALWARGERSRLLGWLDRGLRLARYGVLAWAVIGAGVYGVLVFRDYDPWATLIGLAEFSFTPGVIVLGLTLAGSFFVDRPWCRYACPLGAASSLIGNLSPVYLKREESACTACKVCTKACPMGIDIHTAKTIKSAECIGCLECVGACPRNGALEVKVGVPIIRQ